MRWRAPDRGGWLMPVSTQNIQVLGFYHGAEACRNRQSAEGAFQERGHAPQAGIHPVPEVCGESTQLPPPGLHDKPFVSPVVGARGNVVRGASTNPRHGLAACPSAKRRGVDGKLGCYMVGCA
jgi:hypothetical protein